MQDISVTTDFIKNTLIPFYANFYSIDEGTLKYVVNCESGYMPKVRGDKGHSRGLVQISDIWHPEVSDAEAFNPFFSLDFLAKGVANGRGSEWTCYRNFSAINAP